MKKYNIYNLYVLTINGQRYICESIIMEKKYREVLTGRIIAYREEYTLEKLSDYYSLIERMNFITGKPVMLSKEKILNKYININAINVEDKSFYEDTKLRR